MTTDPGGEVTFASYNVHKCVGIDGRYDPERVGAVIAEINPDVIALQEVDRRFGKRTARLDLERVGRETGLIAVPVSNGHSGHGWHGNVVLVREGLVQDIHQLKLPGLEPRGALVADIDLSCGPVRVMAAHLGLLRQSRLLQVQMLLGHAGEDDGRPVVMMGDFNEWRRRHRRSALHPFGAHFGPLGRGVPSFPSYFPMLALDRIIARPHRILGEVMAHDSELARVASDHLPVKVRVRLGDDSALSALDRTPGGLIRVSA